MIYFRNKYSKEGVVCDGCTFSYWKNVSWQFHNYTIIEEMGLSCYLSISVCQFVWRTNMFFESIGSDR
jgi:hypothetical protein